MTKSKKTIAETIDDNIDDLVKELKLSSIDFGEIGNLCRTFYKEDGQEIAMVCKLDGEKMTKWQVGRLNEVFDTSEDTLNWHLIKDL